MNAFRKKSLWILDKLQNIYLLSFLIPFLGMVGIVIGRGMFPFGDNSFMFSDMYHQYVPFLTELWRKLHAGDTLGFSWYIGLGSDFVATYAYYLACPLNFLVYFCPEQYILEFQTVVILLKIGFCGVTFAYWMKERFGTDRKDLRVVPFAVFYALSGFTAAYNYNNMWLNGVLLAPLILCGLERLMKKGNSGLYCISLFAAIYTNYYISIMICIFLVLYFAVNLFSSGLSFGQKCKATGRFALYSLLAGGMAGGLLLPLFSAMSGSDFVAVSFPKTFTMYFNLLEVVGRHAVMVSCERGLNHWPNIYCGVAVFLLLPIYFAHRRIPITQKILKGLLAVFMLVSFSCNMLNFIWHGMNYPDSLPARQSFLYIALILSMCADAVFEDGDNKRVNRIAGAGIGAVWLVMIGIFVKDDSVTAGDLACTWIFLAGYVLLYLLLSHNIFAKKKEAVFGKKIYAFLWWFLMLLAGAEAIINTESTSVKPVRRVNYMTRVANNRDLVQMAEEDCEDTFFRIDSSHQMTKNDGTLTGYVSASVFSSTVGGATENFYEHYGMINSKVTYSVEDGSPLMLAVLDVQYLISDEEMNDPDLYDYVGTAGKQKLYRNRYCTGLGFGVSQEAYEDLETAYTRDAKGIAALNGLAQIFVPDKRMYKQVIGAEKFVNEVNGVITVTASVDGHLYGKLNSKPPYDLQVTCNDKTLEFKKIDRDVVLDFGWYEKGSVITIEPLYEEGSEPEEGDISIPIRIYRLDVSVLERCINTVNEQRFLVKSYTSGAIDGTIEQREDGYLLLSLPYDEHWTVAVDGAEVTYTDWNDAMIAVPMTAGEHSVSMRYHVSYIKEGIVLSLCSCALFAVFFRSRRRKVTGTVTINLQ